MLSNEIILASLFLCVFDENENIVRVFAYLPNHYPVFETMVVKGVAGGGEGDGIRVANRTVYITFHCFK